MSWSKVGQGEVVSLPRGGWIPVISSETCFVKMASEIWFRPSFWSPNSCFISARNVSSLQNLPLFIKLLGRGKLPKCHLAKLVKIYKKNKGFPTDILWKPIPGGKRLEGTAPRHAANAAAILLPRVVPLTQSSVLGLSVRSATAASSAAVTATAAERQRERMRRNCMTIQ